MINQIPSIERYNKNLLATLDWLIRSCEKGNGGSSAYYSPIKKWSGPYPETTGYIIPTLINASHHFKVDKYNKLALGLGEWLLGLQNADGSWPGGVYVEGSRNEPSVFNTAQILDGMVALFDLTKDEKWLDAANHGSIWLADNVNSMGNWEIGNYRQGVNPSYYTQVTRPMLQVWEHTSDENVRNAAERVLKRIGKLRTDAGVFSGWGFDDNKPAFTHTIAYTLRGFIECAYMLKNWDEYGEPSILALNKLATQAELLKGRLPGAFHKDWRPVKWYSCLTGNAQIALCLLLIEQHNTDLRLVNGACKLVDHVCSSQKLDTNNPDILGAVAGSSPLVGRYMFLRYPNWAAKYHADALMSLSQRLTSEMSK